MYVLRQKSEEMKNLVKLFLSLIIAALMGRMANAQQQYSDSPTSEIDLLLKKIDTILKKEHMPGLMISIVKKDSILFSSGLGYYQSIDLLSKNDLLAMEKVHSTLASQKGLHTGYALGNDLFPNNKKVTFRGHNGKGEGFSSWIFYNREAGLLVSINVF